MCRPGQAWARGAALVASANTGQRLPWSKPLHTSEVAALAEVARHACLAVIAALPGMRTSELAELVVGCRRSTQIAPDLIRYRIAGKRIKGQPLGGLDDEWVVIEQVHHAITRTSSTATRTSAISWPNEPTPCTWGRRTTAGSPTPPRRCASDSPTPPAQRSP